MRLEKLEIGELYYLTSESTRLMIFIPIDENENDYDIKPLYFRSKGGKRALGEIAILMRTHLANTKTLEDTTQKDQQLIIETIFKYKNKAK